MKEKKLKWTLVLVITSLASKIAILKDRAELLYQVRSFFKERGVLEVDCPAISQAAPIDAHIEVMTVAERYLHTSPEYGMKRLLAAGIGDIYQMSHVFRLGEQGPRHNPEFTMIEWYRHALSFQELIGETLDLIRLFLGPLPSAQWRYRQALKHYAQIDYLSISTEELFETLCSLPIGLPKEADQWDKDTLLQLLTSCLVEPHLGCDELTVLTDFPASQAALSKTTWVDEEPIAYRFEVYYRGIELANGYQELTDPTEQARRFRETQQLRCQAGKDPLKIDVRFLEALEQGMPDCCGVAVGFDRLMLLRHQVENIAEILPLSWDEA